MRKIILITGGERSGKSRHAEALALSMASCPVYVATARVWDEEFRERIRIHRERRGVQWENIEEEKYLSRLDVTGRVVLVDCLTLWCTNFFFDRVGDDEQRHIAGDGRRADTVYGAGCHIYFCNQRDRYGRNACKYRAAPVYRLVRLAEPVCGTHG